MRVGAVGLPVGADPGSVVVDADIVVLPECAAGGYEHIRRDTTAQAQRVRPGVIVGFHDGEGSAVGVWDDRGDWVSYRKRFLSPAEARVWRAGQTPVVATVKNARIGLLVCADVLQLQSWEDLRGRVDLVTVSAAWPHYHDRRRIPGISWLYAGSPMYRDTLLGRAARSLGVPVVLANAFSTAFDGTCTLWNPNGSTVATGSAIVSDVSPGTPDGPLHHTDHWRWFAPTYRLAAALAARR